MNEGEFSVYTFDEQGFWVRTHDHVDAEAAVLGAHALTLFPIKPHRVIIEDGDGYTCFEWLRDKGVTFGANMADSPP